MTTPVRYAHVRQKRLNYTIAYTFEKDANGNLSIAYGVAQCRRNDTFTRADGRAFAEGRLNKALKSELNQDLYYGSFTAKDEPGVPVSKLVRDAFEGDRKVALAAYNQQSVAVQAGLNALRDMGFRVG
jgi:hypothetical protein